MKGRPKNTMVFCYLWAAFIVAVATIPTLAGYLYAPAGTVFTGNARFTLDYNTYLSFMLQAVEGNTLFQEMYWSWPNPALLFQPLFLLLGLLARWTGMGLAASHEAGRILFGFLLLVLLYKCISLMFKEAFERGLAFVLVSFGGGLAWLYPWINPGGITVEQHYITGWVEANTYLSIMAFPLFSSSLLLMVCTFFLLLLFLEKGGTGRCVLLGASAALLSLNHPYDILIAASVGGAFLALSFLLFRRDFGAPRILQAASSLAIALAAVAVYFYTVSSANPAFSYWSGKMHDPSPPFTWVAANFGLIGPAALVGILGVLISARKNPRLVFLGVWGVVGCLIIYLPCNFQRRLIEGLHIPLSLLATFGVLWIAGEKGVRRRFAVLFVLLCLPANVMTTLWTVRQLKENRGRMSPYLTREERGGLDWLRENTGKDAAVLAGYRMSNFIPAFAGNHVFWGRWVNEEDFARRHALARVFFSPETSDGARIAFAIDNNVRYLLWEKEGAETGDFTPSESPILAPVYRNGDVAVFRVARP